MTLAALLLRDAFFRKGLSTRMKYATLGVLFVNVSIGGTLTPFAAPPVLMVAGAWNWDIVFMMGMFGWKAALAVLINAVATTILFRRELWRLSTAVNHGEHNQAPLALVVTHLALLAMVVVFAHHAAMFLGIFLFFLGIAQAYERYQDRLILREGLLVAFFLAGLVVLGGQQQWWLQPMDQRHLQNFGRHGKTGTERRRRGRPAGLAHPVSARRWRRRPRCAPLPWWQRSRVLSR